MNHPPKGIFTPIRNEPLTGRNANIQPTMFKRKEIFEKAQSQQRFQTPFSGYSFTGSSVTDNSLARSQVSQFSQQNVIRLIKEQLQKNGLTTLSQTSQESLKNKNELNILRIQIRSIKESYHELNKAFKKRLEEQAEVILEVKKDLMTLSKDNTANKEEVSSLLVDKIKEVEQDIAMKMRLIFGKMQEDLRKELTNYANREFVPTSFLDDLDKQLNELDDRIANIQSQYESTKATKENSSSKADKDSSLILGSGSQLKLKQFQRDLTNLKKQLDEKSLQIKQLNETLSFKSESQAKQLATVKQSVNDLSSSLNSKISNVQTSSLEKVTQQLQNQRKNINFQLESQLQKLTKRIDQQFAIKLESLSNGIQSEIQPDQFIKKTQSTSILMQNNDVLTESLKSEDTRDASKISALNLTNPSGNSSGILLSNNMPSTKNLSPPAVSSSPSNTLNDSPKDQKQSPKKTKKITITYNNSTNIIPSPQSQQTLISQQTQVQPAPSKEPTSSQQFKTLYKVDKDGYLMDADNKYLLSPNNSLIFVSEKQIEAMQKTMLVKVQKWDQQKIQAN